MKILLDTNVLVSGALNHLSNCYKLLNLISINHTILVCDYTVDELYDVFKRKFPMKIESLDLFLSQFKFALVQSPRYTKQYNIVIRDPKDIPIVASAIFSGADILISGDLDFFTPEVQDLVRVLTPAEALSYLDTLHN